ncbi:uncharacterized protein LOC117317810 [Pecten maximus]|uniref:uncharacterized protein LOC117317810 n=1 Tax=Pecten maximus TaxID=6579 RepID=UPI001458CEE4|nr:uncharacterized protein LOC117317810 [Pecten maximus]
MPVNKPINYRNLRSQTTTTDQELPDNQVELNGSRENIVEEIDIQPQEQPEEIMTHIQIRRYDGTESPQIWYSSMEAWMKVQGYTESKMLSALPLILEGPAALWLQTQPQASTASLAAFKVAFFQRFGIKDNDMSFMSLKQDTTESALAFIERAEKTGLGAALPECYKVKAAVRGLSPNLRSRVIGKEPTSFLDLRKAVQLASEELDCFESQEVKNIDFLTERFAQMSRNFSETILQQVNQLQHQNQNQNQQQWRHKHHQRQEPHRDQQRQSNRSQQRQCQGCGVNSVSQMWTFLAVMFLCIPLVVAESSPIQRLNYGIMFEPTTLLHLGQEYWTHTFKIPLPSPMYLPGIPSCQRQTCKVANQVVTSLNNLRTQCMSNVNSTVKEIHRLIPHSYFPNTLSSSRSKRGLLDFIGQISKSLFGTATSDDVEDLKRHMQVLNNNNVKLARAMASQSHQLTSFMAAVDERLDNIVEIVKNNHDQTMTLSEQFSASLDGIEHELVLLENLMITQINATSTLDKHLEHAKLAIHDLAKGKLSPFLLSPQIMRSTLKQVQNIMSSKYKGFSIIHNDPLYYYHNANFVYARHHSMLYLLVKIPISPFIQPLHVYKVYSAPVPVNSTSSHATQLLNTPEYFVHTSDNQHFSTLSHKQLQECSGSDILYCKFQVALSSVAKSSCIAAIFYNQKDMVKTTCDFRFLPDILSPAITELAPSNLLMYQIPMLALDCPNGQRIIKGCSFCVVRIPCMCTVTAGNLFVPPRLGQCKNDTNDISVIHPVNLALLQEFFPSSQHASIFGDTSYPDFVRVKIPDVNIYNHSFTEKLATDQKYHLSLKKIVKTAKKGEIVFKSLAESMLEGQIPFTSGTWPDTSGVIALVGTAISGIAIILIFCLYSKLRKISAMMLLVQKAHTVQTVTVSPQIPSFHFQSLPNPTSSYTITENVYNSLMTPWPYVTLSLLTTVFILASIYCIRRKFHNNHKTAIFLELSSGTACELVRIASLPLCPDNWTISPPIDINNIQVFGRIFPVLSVEWSEFSIINNNSKHRIYPTNKVRLSPMQAHSIRKILSQPYAAYTLVCHHGYFHPL